MRLEYQDFDDNPWYAKIHDFWSELSDSSQIAQLMKYFLVLLVQHNLPQTFNHARAIQIGWLSSVNSRNNLGKAGAYQIYNILSWHRSVEFQYILIRWNPQNVQNVMIYSVICIVVSGWSLKILKTGQHLMIFEQNCDISSNHIRTHTALNFQNMFWFFWYNTAFPNVLIMLELFE